MNNGTAEEMKFVLESSNIPQYQALKWLVYDDPYFDTVPTLSPNSTQAELNLTLQVIDRYALSTLYFSTQKSPPKIDNDDGGWSQHAAWLSQITCREWQGIECGENGGHQHVTDIVLGK